MRTPDSTRALLLTWTTVLVMALLPLESSALPDFAAETGLACSDCHEEGADGGTLTQTGMDFLAGDLELGEDEAPQASPATRVLRGLVRYVHLVSGVVWFGAIAYIHLFTRPRKLTKGLPRAEMRLGWYSIITMAITGTLLTVWKLGSVSELWTTSFGFVWMIKVGTFLLLVLIAAVVTTALNRAMRRAASEDGGPGACGLIRFAYDGKLYDATDSRWWEGGVHAGRHRAGTDLTQEMADAPHGPEVLSRIKIVGPIPSGCSQPLPKAARAFVALAYVNLVLIAVILFCVSFWGWGLSLLH
jgi:predicted heme/steroid binding protein